MKRMLVRWFTGASIYGVSFIPVTDPLIPVFTIFSFSGIYVIFDRFARMPVGSQTVCSDTENIQDLATIRETDDY